MAINHSQEVESEDDESNGDVNLEPGFEIDSETDEWKTAYFLEKDWEAFELFYENTFNRTFEEDIGGDTSS